MKPFENLKKGIVLFLLLSTVSAFAGNTPEIRVIHAGKKTFAVYFDNETNGMYSLRLKDRDGVVLLSDRLNGPKEFGRKYNLSNLPAGNYYLFIEQGGRTVVQPVALSTEDVTVMAGQVTLFTPSVRVTGDKLDYTLLCLNEMPVTIEIVDELGRPNYDVTKNEKGSVQRRFDIRSLSSGTYRIVTTLHGPDYDKQYSEVFTVGEALAGN